MGREHRNRCMLPSPDPHCALPRHRTRSNQGKLLMLPLGHPQAKSFQVCSQTILPAPRTVQEPVTQLRCIKKAFSANPPPHTSNLPDPWGVADSSLEAQLYTHMHTALCSAAHTLTLAEPHSQEADQAAHALGSHAWLWQPDVNYGLGLRFPPLSLPLCPGCSPSKWKRCSH